ncbi:serine hydroxymethyltransferase [Candidatus Falkowbacteria bacterium]|nr:serine hydroxymethyltransferase [Candidatus Falkowbacteria bacterium]
MKNIQNFDPQIADLIAKETNRQEEGLVMIASENYASQSVMEAMNSPLQNKYSEGYPGKRYYTGNEFVDQIENLAIARAKEIFGVEHVNVQPHSGSTGNAAAYMACLKPGDTILGMNLSHGGHLTHGSPVNFSGQTYKFVSYGVSSQNEQLDYEEIRRLALEHKPKMIVCGATAYPRAIDFKKFSEIAKEVQAYLHADISHIAGIIVAGVHQSPVGYADTIMTTTQKTLKVPRSDIIIITIKDQYQ